MTTQRKPWTVGRLREELAKYPAETQLRVAVTDPNCPNSVGNWEHVVLSAARGQEKFHGEGDITMTPFLIIESYPLPRSGREKHLD